ncbi:MAG: type II secretion system protein [Planctomycetota bacterium]|jgi:prepilin-type N-terminal cleavage/methylation domain-containing protein
MKRAGRQRVRSTGFTLIEIMIVVALIAILAALVVPVIDTSTNEAQQIAFVADLRLFGDAAMRYHFDSGQWLEDSSTGVLPAGWASYIDEEKWTSLTPIGGAWDCELDSYGVKSALGVDFANGGGMDRDDAYMEQIDAIFDDGDLTTGQFRRIAAGRYYIVLADS